MIDHRKYFVSNDEEGIPFLTTKEFFSGWMAGIAGLLASHPLDTIKVITQEGKGTTLAATKMIYREWGYLGFYKGVFVPALMAGVQNAIFFGAFANTYRLLPISNSTNSDANLSKVIISGNVAGLVQTMLTTPVEVIKIRIQTAHAGVLQSGILTTCKNMWIHGGPQSFFKGFGPTLVRDMPTGGLYMVIYKYMDQALEPYIGSYWAHCFAGGSAGLLSYLPSLPADVIKTRIQADSLVKPKYRSTVHCVLVTFKDHGPSCFFQGWLPFSVRAFFNNAALFVVYEFCLKLL